MIISNNMALQLSVLASCIYLLMPSFSTSREKPHKPDSSNVSSFSNTHAIEKGCTSGLSGSQKEDLKVALHQSIPFLEFSVAIKLCGFPGPSLQQYNSFINGIVFSSITSKRELAMFLAQILHESNGLRAKEELRCMNHGCPSDYDRTK